MAFDAYIQIQGIKGDSTDDKHKDWIEVISYNHAIQQITGGSSSAQGAFAGGKSDHADFSIVKMLDSASPLLAKYCCDATPIPEIVFELCRAMGDKTVFMKYTMKDAIVSSTSPTGNANGDDAIPLEQVSFRYGEIHWEYTPTDPTGGGKTGAAVQAGWSPLKNKPL